jgi:hypothetical protein
VQDNLGGVMEEENEEEINKETFIDQTKYISKGKSKTQRIQ